MDTTKLSNGVLLALYRYWSEETHAAAFLTPTEDSVRAFRQWLDRLETQQAQENYEREFLEVWRKLDLEE